MRFSTPALHHYSTTAPPHYNNPALQHDITTAQQQPRTPALQHTRNTAPLHYITPALQHYSTTALLSDEGSRARAIGPSRPPEDYYLSVITPEILGNLL
jgi:hypothetical protein